MFPVNSKMCRMVKTIAVAVLTFWNMRNKEEEERKREEERKLEEDRKREKEKEREEGRKREKRVKLAADKTIKIHADFIDHLRAHNNQLSKSNDQLSTTNNQLYAALPEAKARKKEEHSTTALESG